MKSRFVGHCFLKQAKHRVSDCLLDARPSRDYFFAVDAFSKWLWD